MSEIVITVPGVPAPQGSKKYVGQRKGRAVLVESSKKVGPWRETVEGACMAFRACNPHMSWPLTGPLGYHMTFYFARPQGHYGTGRNAGQLRLSAPHRHGQYPDVSKLQRSTEDALTTGGIWADDSLACVAQAAKWWCNPASGTCTPGAVIRIWQVAP